MVSNSKKLKDVLGFTGVCCAAAIAVSVGTAANAEAAELAPEAAQIVAEDITYVNADAMAADEIQDSIVNLVDDAVVSEVSDTDDAEAKAAEERRAAEEKAEKERKAAEEKAEAERQAAEDAAEEAAEKAEAERKAAEEKAEKERKEAEEREAAEKAEEERKAAEEAAREQSEKAQSVLPAEDYAALCKIVQAEAGGESYEGKVAVANVVMNRVRNASYPSSVTAVITQPGQFTPVRTGKYAVSVPSADTVKAVNAALTGTDYSAGALYFKRSSNSTWGSKVLIQAIGNHGFYI
ncbi:MAG: cell wall hydrolase [Lachnospiraceae bacterium]|nr:cell wall hydrolase [Lachnospiraceae bacterium]